MRALPSRTPKQVEQEELLLNTPMLVEHTVLYDARPYYFVRGTWYGIYGDGTYKRPYLYHEIKNQELIDKFNALINETSL